MRVVQRRRGLANPAHRLLAAYRSHPNGVRNGAAGEVLHDDERARHRVDVASVSLEVADVVDRHHMGVRRHPSRGAGLALEPPHRHVVMGEALGQHLDRHRTPQDQILGAPHRGHAAGREPAANPVAVRKPQLGGLGPGLPSRTHWGDCVPGWLVSNPRSDTDGRGRGVRRSRLLYCPRCPKSVTCAPRVRPSAITAAIRWSRPSAASIRTFRGSASTTAGHRDACMSARAASKPARSPKLAERGVLAGASTITGEH